MELQISSSVLLVSLLASVAGCTHRQLQRSTLNTAEMVMDIEYNTILANLAMLYNRPAALPSHVRLEDGVVQISDRAGIGGSGGFTTFGGTAFGIDRLLGPSASRSVTEQWGTDAVEDPRQLKQLQNLYRHALGLPPLPDPSFLTKADELTTRPRARAGQPAPSKQPQPAEKTKQPDCPPGSFRPDCLSIHDVPQGWFRVGQKNDVPRNACYVGRYHDTYVWVMPDGMEGLSGFALAVLTIVKLSPSAEQRTEPGLVFTP